MGLCGSPSGPVRPSASSLGPRDSTGVAGTEESLLITSAHNAKLKLIRRLLDSRRQREKEGLFVCEGEDLVAAARDAGSSRSSCSSRARTSSRAPRRGLDARASAACDRRLPPRGAAARHAPATLALWHLADPGNVGTLLRTADAFGAGVALSAGAPTRPARRRCGRRPARSSGCRWRRSTTRRVRGSALVAHGADASGRRSRDEGSFVLGAEREGLPADVVARCDAQATIPLEPGSESLNVAAAGAIALYEARRAR